VGEQWRPSAPRLPLSYRHIIRCCLSEKRSCARADYPTIIRNIIRDCEHRERACASHSKIFGIRLVIARASSPISSMSEIRPRGARQICGLEDNLIAMYTLEIEQGAFSCTGSDRQETWIVVKAPINVTRTERNIAMVG